jgi:hypothetical protein
MNGMMEQIHRREIPAALFSGFAALLLFDLFLKESLGIRSIFSMIVLSIAVFAGTLFVYGILSLKGSD